MLATLGGQTALNTAVALHEQGILEKYDVELIGADFDAIQRGEDRQKFKDIVAKVGGESARSAVCYTMDEVHATVAELGYPVVVRPSFTMGGLGSGMAYNEADLERIAGGGLAASPTANVLIEESILGWKEYELELMRDGRDNVVIVCSIENVDPVGVHTGDSITVAPAMTLTDREYQKMRDLSIAILREVGVDTGGCNIQFAMDPSDGRLVVIEMNPRVSRSSALASKATGYPIAKMAAKLAIGYTLDEIVNDITRETPACFEPTLDYVVVKAPRFAFEKFPGADGTLTTTMKSVGEAMSIGRNFTEAFGKVLRSLETKRAGFWTGPEVEGDDSTTLLEGDRDAHTTAGSTASSRRSSSARPSSRSSTPPRSTRGSSRRSQQIVELGDKVRAAETFDERAAASGQAPRPLRPPDRGAAPRARFAGRGRGPRAARRARGAPGLQDRRHLRRGVRGEDAVPLLDLRARSRGGDRGRAADRASRKVLILGSGPNRIGQGIEFDYSCVHAALTLSEAGYETVMVNCNPETVSTDYDTADRLYFEPLTFEDVLEVYRAESRVRHGRRASSCSSAARPRWDWRGGSKAAGCPDRGDQPRGDRPRRGPRRVRPRARRGRSARRRSTAPPPRSTVPATSRPSIGYPVLVRPSYVLGGRGMEIVYDEKSLEDYISRATEISDDRPVLVDRFLDDAVEIDVDALCDGTEVYIGGVMEHIEEAGIHSGDSACALPPITLGRADIENVRRSTEALANGHRRQGPAQRPVRAQGRHPVRPRGQSAREPHGAVRVQGHRGAAGQGVRSGDARRVHRRTARRPGCCPPRATAARSRSDAPVAVKEAVLPFNRFRRADGTGVDTLLSPEMKSTGEVMGIDDDFGTAFAKSQTAAYGSLPTSGTVFVSVANKDKRSMIFPVKRLADLGFHILATDGHRRGAAPQRYSVRTGVQACPSEDRPEGAPDIVDRIRAGDVDMVINTPCGNSGPRVDGYEIRSAAVAANIPCITTVQGASAAVQGIEAAIRGDIGVSSLQELHARLREAAQSPDSREHASGRGSRTRSRAAGRCASASTRIRSCSTAWGLGVDADGLEQVQ